MKRHWLEPLCMGCNKPFLTCGIISQAIDEKTGQPVGPTHIEQDRMCGECREWLAERMAQQIDPTYDPSKRNEWTDCWARLRKLYCWPHTDEIGDDLLWVSFDIEERGRQARLVTVRHSRESTAHPWVHERFEGEWFKVK